MTQRTHPITLLQFVWRFMFLLIIPAGRGFLTALSGGNITEWLTGAWFDILIVLVIFTLAFVQWWNLFYRWDSVGLCLQKGFLFRRRQLIPAKRVITLSVTDPFYLRPFRAVRFRIDTLAGSGRGTDITLIITKKSAQAILSKREKALNHPHFSVREYHPKVLYITCLSAILSSSFAGVVFIATFISQTGSLLGQEFSDRIAGTFERLTRAVAWGLPPATVAVAYLLLFGWVFSFVRNLIRHKNFLVRRGENELFIKSGVITSRAYSLQISQISAIDIRQSLFTKILGLFSVFVDAVGYGKEKDDLSAMIPANSWNKMLRHLHFLLPEFTVTPRKAKPNKGAILRFLWEPILPCLAIPLGAWLLGVLFPSWADFVWSIAFMSMIPAVWFLLVRVLDYLSTGVGYQDGVYTLRYSSGIHLHTVILPKEKVSQAVLRQSPLQAFDRKCDVILYSLSEKRKKHHIRNLDLAEACELFFCNETQAVPYAQKKRPFIGLTEYLHPFSNYFKERQPLFSKNKGKNSEI